MTRRWTDALIPVDLTKAHQTRRPNKYGAEKVKDGTRTFDSKLEHEMYALLLLMERQKLISNVRHHPAAISLTSRVRFKIDFIVFEKKRQMDIGVEAKGIDNPRWRVIKQLWPDFGPMPMQVWKKAGNRLFMSEEIKGKP